MLEILLTIWVATVVVVTVVTALAMPFAIGKPRKAYTASDCMTYTIGACVKLSAIGYLWAQAYA